MLYFCSLLLLFVLILVNKFKRMDLKDSPYNQSQEWKQFRAQFGQGSAIASQEQVCELITKWIDKNHQQQFSQLLLEMGDKIQLRQVIKQVVNQQKYQGWKISQNYSQANVQQIIEEIKINIKERFQAINQQQLPNPLIGQTNKIIQKQPQRSKHNQAQGHQQYISVSPNEFLSSQTGRVGFLQLPAIRAKGRVYDNKDLSRSFHLLKQTQEQYQMRSPYMFQSSKSGSAQKDGIFSNKYLKKAFYNFCQQSYSQKKTFGNTFEQGQKMNMNKWMVFCKQFDFNQKFALKDLVSIYQSATNRLSSMTLDQFLTAVALLQEQYVKKYHRGDNFVGDVLNINSEAALRYKMANLKVRCNQPTVNFFEKANYPQHIRLDDLKKQKEFLSIKKERQLVLVKGMLPDHINSQLVKLKSMRQQKQQQLSNHMNKSLHVGNMQSSPLKNDMPRVGSQSRYAKTKKDNQITYSKVFATHRDQKQANIKKQAQSQVQSTKQNIFKTAAPAKAELRHPENNPQNLDLLKSNQQYNKRNQDGNKQKQAVSRKNVFATNKQPQRSWIPQKPQDTTWLTKIRNDSEESDQILKQHLQSEKKMGNRESQRLQKLKRQMQQHRAKVQKIEGQMKAQVEDDMVQTQAYFRK